MRTQNLLFILFFASVLHSQSFTRLTNLKNYGFRSPYDKISTLNGKLYHCFLNYNYQLEIYKYDNNEKKFINKINLDRCNDRFISVLQKDSFIITIYRDSISFFDFINIKTITKSYPNGFSFNSITENIKMRKDIILFGYYNNFAYDLTLNKFVPAIKGSYLYRSHNNYYSIIEKDHFRYLYKRKFEDKISTSVNIKPIKFNQCLNNLLYLQDSSGVLYTIDKNDEIKLSINGLSHIYKIIQTGNNRLSILGKNNAKNFIKTYSLPDYSLTNLYNFEKYFDFAKVFYSNNKLFFNIENKATYYNCNTNTIYLISDTISIFNTIDTLVFMRNANAWGHNFEVLNTKSGEIKQFNIPFEKNIHKIFKSGSEYYFYLFNHETGYGLYKYQFGDNFIETSNYIINKNAGFNSRMNVSSDFIFFTQHTESSDIQIIDETENDNIDFFKFKDKKTEPIIIVKNKIYYLNLNSDFADSNNTTVNLNCYNIESNMETILASNIILPKNEYKIFKLNKYIVLRIFGGHNTIVINTENNQKIELSEFQKELFNHHFFNTNNYFYSEVNDIIYKVSLDNLSYTKYTNEISHRIKHIINNEFVFLKNNNIYYHNGFETNIIYEGDSSLTELQIYTSPDKRYFTKPFIMNKIRHYLIYDRNLKTINIIEPFPKDTLQHSDNVNIFNNQLIISNNEDKIIYVYNLNNNMEYKREFTSGAKLFSIGDNEIHFLINDKIVITNNNLEQIETIPFKYYFMNYFEYYPLISISNDQNIYLSYNYKGYQSLIFYDRRKRKLNDYFTCEDSIWLDEVRIVKDNIYCLASNDTYGGQIYVENIKNLLNSNQTQKEPTIGKIEIYPNPCYDYINLANPINNYKIINIHGMVIRAVKDVTTTKIDIKNLPAGLYFINSIDMDHTKSGKFIKIKYR